MSVPLLLPTLSGSSFTLSKKSCRQNNLFSPFFSSKMTANGSSPFRILPTAVQTLIVLIALIPLGTSERIENGDCPSKPDDLIHSPFKPYWTWWTDDSQRCWTAAICLLQAADEARKQQFAATALVMGLIPLTLKDIAWPERRVIYVTKTPGLIIETLVLALGLVPTETGSSSLTRAKNCERNSLAKWAWGKTRWYSLVWIVLSTAIMLASFAGIAVMELYSKRSSLGCPFPAFVLMWYLVALLPAGIHAGFAVRRRRQRMSAILRARKSVLDVTRGQTNKSNRERVQIDEDANEREPEQIDEDTSAVQGANEEWPVQLAWGIYYIAGTLIFSSIMAVTVVELMVWVGLGFAVAASNKLLAFFTCLVFERTGPEDESFELLGESERSS
ncbi:hypothetical protein BCR34DRAFT_578230 [Clohesyomyces aquaticus]|uniref:Uncharacterized protein n=1 Tax=Clohesyomyces aquaticus TaxID=1231657 RepID=A0A1Y1YH13_9PLEO|nr:hypothetical protein BCR34DRAFT_578230 [Clohesyomyces aquaticus]